MEGGADNSQFQIDKLYFLLCVCPSYNYGPIVKLEYSFFLLYYFYIIKMS